jgi:hypothetical protein
VKNGTSKESKIFFNFLEYFWTKMPFSSFRPLSRHHEFDWVSAESTARKLEHCFRGAGKTTSLLSASFCYGNGYIWQAILT